MSGHNPSCLRLGVIGLGQWGPNLVRNFASNPRVELKALADFDAKRLATICENYPGTLRFDSAVGLLQSCEIDAVVISTPTASHFGLVQEALTNGKHVFVEKPLTTTTREAKTLVALADSLDKKLMCGHVFLFNPAIRYVKQLIEEKALGEIFYLYFTRTNMGPIRGDVNALWDLAPHDISILLYLLGSLPESTSARGASFINPPIEDVVFANLRFPRGIFANLHVSWLDPKKVRQLVVVGSQKMLVFDDMNPSEPVKVFDKNVAGSLSQVAIADTFHLFRKSIVEGTCSIPTIEHAEPLHEECTAFVNYVLDNTPNPSTSALSVNVVTVLEQISQSMQQEGSAFHEITESDLSSIAAPQTPLRRKPLRDSDSVESPDSVV